MGRVAELGSLGRHRMSRYRAIIAEVATGIVRRADSPEMRFRDDLPGHDSRTFESEHLALQFKDEVLGQFTDLEVTVRPEEATVGGVRYFWQDGRIVGEAFVLR